MEIKTALRELIENLDKIAVKHQEIIDTAVREELAWTIRDYFILPVDSFQPGTDKVYYAMFSKEADKEVHQALSQFLNHPDVIATRIELKSPEERLAAFQDREVVSSSGSSYDNYFGWIDGESNDFAE